MTATTIVGTPRVVKIGITVKDEDDPDMRKFFQAICGICRHTFFKLEVATRSRRKAALPGGAAALSEAGADGTNGRELKVCR